MTNKELRNSISQILVKWGLPSRQIVISEIVNLIDEHEAREETFYSTVVSSDAWKEWVAIEERKNKWDVHESTECNLLSKEHFEAFIEWVGNERIKEEFKREFKDLNKLN